MIDLHLTPAVMLFWLVAGHFLADYPLQGDFLATAKDRNSALGKLFWPHALAAHAFIHAAFVALFTGSIALALLEAVIHAYVDHAKCQKRISLNADQAIHLFCKVCWVVAVMEWRAWA
jgi:hypothetical protein